MFYKILSGMVKPTLCAPGSITQQIAIIQHRLKARIRAYINFLICHVTLLEKLNSRYDV